MGIDSCFKSSFGRLNRFKTIKACNERVCLAGASAGLGLGYGIGANPAVLAGAPEMVSLIFGGSGIVAAAAVAILLNIVLPKDSALLKKDSDN